MKRATIKAFSVSLALIFVIGLLMAGGAPASAAGPASLGRTPWQMFRPATYVSTPNYSPTHGDTRYYNFAPAIPASNDSGWGPAPDGNTINFHVASRLSQCWVQADFTFFQSFVSIPANATVTEFKVVMNGADDGARVSIINSLYPTGLVIAGSYIFLGPSQSTTDLSPYIALGEVNRVVITQMDDCPVGNNLNYAAISLNGTVVQVNQPPVVAANNSSVAVNEGQTASNTGTFSDPDGNPVALSASVGTVTASGPGTWSWSYNTTDGPVQSQTVTITANDGNGGIATTTFPLTVTNVAPALSVNVNTGNSVYYVNWTAANPGAGTASGVINLPDGSTVNVTFEALNPNNTPSFYYSAQTNGGTNFWVPSTPYISAQVPNAPPDPDIIQLSGGNSTIYKVTLSQPIVDPIMAIVSLGSGGNTITYNFNSPFTIVSQAPGFFGGCSTCLAQLPNNVLQGREGHGTIKFLGTYSTFSWTVPNPEVWHGFTFAIRTTASLGNTNVNEGQTATNSGIWSDPGVNDNVMLSASVGQVVKNANGTWNWSFATTDGPAQSQTVTITATDKDGASTIRTFPLVVTNVAPTATLNAPASATAGSPFTVSLTGPSDPSSVDVGAGFQYAFDCGAGFGPYGPSGTTSCVGANPGALTVKGKIKDKDNGETTYTASVNILVPPPPAFSNDKPLPGADACICLPPFMVQDPSASHFWWARATGVGNLEVDLYALSVNAAETGSVTARVYNPSNTLVGTATVAHPATLEAPATPIVISGATPGSLYRVAITINPPSSGAVARHYRLKLKGASLLGANSPLQAQSEHDNANWAVNVGSGENLDVVVQGGPEAPATTATIQVRNPSGALVATGSLGAPIHIGGAATGMWTISVKGADAHYIINKTTGADRGIYVTWMTWGFSSLSGAITRAGLPNATPVTVEVVDNVTNAVVASAPGVTGGYSFPKVPAGSYTVRVVTPPNLLAPANALRDLICDGAATANFDIPNRPPTVTLTAPPSVNEGAPAASLGATATDPDGDPVTFAWTLTGPGALTPSAGTATYSNNDGPATATVQVTVSDPFGATASDSKVIATNNVNPTANAGPDVTQFWGLPVALTGAGADVSPVDVAAGLIATWVFGDGPGTASGFSVTHTYAAPGGYTATLTVKDKDGGAGSDTALATINKRGTTVAYTGATTSTFGFAATLSAKLTDVVDAGTALLGGRTITFTVNGNTITATTDAAGVATATAPALLPPGTYPVAVGFATDSHYLASSAQGTLTVQNTVGGKVTAGTLRSANNGRGGFNVQADGAGVKGELEFQNNAINFHAPTMTALGVSPDKKKAWFAGVGKDGAPFVAYVEDNGEPGRNDKFQIWIGGTSQNGDGSLTGGNVQIH